MALYALTGLIQQAAMAGKSTIIALESLSLFFKHIPTVLSTFHFSNLNLLYCAGRKISYAVTQMIEEPAFDSICVSLQSLQRM